MARRTETREIEGITYEAQQLGAVKGREVLVRVAKLFGPALKSLQGAKDAGALASGLGALLESLNEADLAYLCDALSPSTTVHVGSKRPALSDIFDAHFAGDNLLAMFKWLAFALELNFASFFGGPGGLKSAISGAFARVTGEATGTENASS